MENSREELADGRDSRPGRYAAPVIVGAALCLRILGLNKGLWMDETYSVLTISADTLRAMLRTMRWGNQPPLYYVVLRFWSMLSTDEVMLRLLSVVLSLAVILIVMYLMKRYSPSAALFSGLVLAAFPLVLRYSQEIRPYGLLLLATALAFCFASQIIAQPERTYSYLGLAVSLSAAILTHLVGIFLFLPVCLFVLLRNPSWRSVSIPGSVAVIASVTAVILAVRYYLLGMESVTSNWWMPPISLSLMSSVAKNATAMTSTSTQTAGTLLDLLTQGGALLAFILLTVAALFGDWRRSLPFSIAALAYWMELVAYSVVQKPVFFDRTALPGLVPFSGFVGLQVATISKRWIRNTAIGALLLMACCFATRWAVTGAWKPIDETKALSELFESKRQGHELVIIYPDYYDVSLSYYARPIPGEDLIKVPVGAPIGGIKRAIESALSGQAGGPVPRSLFLIMRVDALTKHDRKTYEELLSILESHRTDFRAIHLFLMKSPEGGSETVEELRNWWGQPVSTQEFTTFLYARYEPGQAR